MEVVRERALEEAVKSHSLWRRAVLSGCVEEITKPKEVAHVRKREVHSEG